MRLIFTLLIMLCAGCKPGGPPPPEVPPVSGRWLGTFTPTDMSIGGFMPIEAHDVSVELNLSVSDGGALSGVGQVTNLLGSLAALAMVAGGQPGTVAGVNINGDIQANLQIPPFGAPPAPATIILNLKQSGETLVGTCSVNLAGSGSTPVPCTLERSAPL